MQKGEAMKTYDFVHLVIHAAGDRVQGRTKLQKLVYFVGAIKGNLERLGYRAHYYGPYSPDVAGAVQELRSLKFLEQQRFEFGGMDKSGFEISRYDYRLTEEGQEVAEEKARANPTDWEVIKKAVQAINSTNTQDYVQLAIAAKTHLLSKKGGKGLSAKELEAMTAQHGWSAFTPDQFQEAMEFLRQVDLIPKKALSWPSTPSKSSPMLENSPMSSPTTACRRWPTRSRSPSCSSLKWPTSRRSRKSPGTEKLWVYDLRKNMPVK
jgi:uncharacterized protein